eukprot:1927325-Prymnesium_polylepis.1
MSTRSAVDTGCVAAVGAAWPVAARSESSATKDTTRLPAAAPALPCSATDCFSMSLPPLRT